MSETPRRLYRSTKDRKVWGVCGGLAEYFNIDPVLVRVIFVVLTFFSGAGILLYIVLAIVAPSAPPAQAGQVPLGTAPAGPGTTATGQQEAVQRGSVSRGGPTAATIIGIVLIVIGGILLLSYLGRVWWAGWAVIGPAILIILGILLFFARRR